MGERKGEAWAEELMPSPSKGLFAKNFFAGNSSRIDVSSSSAARRGSFAGRRASQAKLPGGWCPGMPNPLAARYRTPDIALDWRSLCAGCLFP